MVNDDGAARKAQMRAVFDRVAVEYDVAGPGCFAYFGQRLVDAVGIEPGQRVLDVASGRGAVLFPAAERVGAAGSAMGIDFAEGMARVANEEAARRGSSARIQVMDAEHLEFSDASFDRVLCGFGLMFFPHLDQALSEVRRVLAPGGRFGASTWQVSQADDLRAVLDDLELGGPGEPGWITDPDALTSLLARAGFAEPRVVVETTSFRYPDLDTYWQNARGTGLRRRLDALDAEQTQRVRSALTERVKPHQRSDGVYLEATALLGVAGR